jgi:murein DD-endopeptidase MepM/ murein hydrolase activator NlpD
MHKTMQIGAHIPDRYRGVAALRLSLGYGRVEAVYNDQMLGTTVIINHGGSLKSIYCNLAATPAVKAGDTVRMGDVIGSVGETALAEIGDVAHLHFQMSYDGRNINPSNYLPGC